MNLYELAYYNIFSCRDLHKYEFMNYLTYCLTSSVVAMGYCGLFPAMENTSVVWTIYLGIAAACQ